MGIRTSVAYHEVFFGSIRLLITYLVALSIKEGKKVSEMWECRFDKLKAWCEGPSPGG